MFATVPHLGPGPPPFAAAPTPPRGQHGQNPGAVPTHRLQSARRHRGRARRATRRAAQIVFDQHDDESPLPFERLHEGQHIVVEATPAGPSSSGSAEHPVHDFIRLISVDGEKPTKRRAAAGAAYEGVVARVNYARHGAANGVVLDTGDFVHTKPEGMEKLGLKAGDKVAVDGDAQMLSTGTGWAVDATRVNGKTLRRD